MIDFIEYPIGRLMVEVPCWSAAGGDTLQSYLLKPTSVGEKPLSIPALLHNYQVISGVGATALAVSYPAEKFPR